MAASLLAPLLPEGIKEEEERWRRKVICKEVEPVSEEKETSTTEEAAAVKPQEVLLDSVEDPTQEDLCSVVQSGESEEEEEQDTLELELVLERKKVSFCEIYFPPSGLSYSGIIVLHLLHWWGRESVLLILSCRYV